MLAFAVMFVVFALLHIPALLGREPAALRGRRAKGSVALASMLVFTATPHFVGTEAFVQSIPAGLPLRREAVYLSGLLELAGAVGLLIPRLRRPAGLALALMFVAVFPANLNVAINNLQIDGPYFPTSPAMQWGRLLIQPVLIWWALWATAAATRAPAALAASPGRQPSGLAA
jgi:uncharacterized membrane protein